MSKIGLLVCGNSGIDYINHNYEIPVIRSILLVANQEFTDYIDISADEFYQMIQNDTSLTPSTAQAATGVMMEQYNEMFEKGYDELLVVTISDKLSGTYEGALMASKMVDGKVTVFNSLTVAYPQAKMILKAAEMVNNNKPMEEIIRELEYIRDHNRIYFAVDTLRYLVKNGRLSGAQGFVGSLLKVKPLLTVTKEGKVESLEKIRTTKKAMNRVVEKINEEIKDKDVELFIIHANALERVELLREKLLASNPDITEINDYPLTPVVGAHAGPKTVAVGYIEKKEE